MRERKQTVLRALALALALLVLPRWPAAAAAEDTATVTAVKGTYVRVFIDMPDGETMRDHTVLDGHPAPGLLLRAEGEGLALVGRPTEEGEWTILVSVRTDSGEKELAIEQYIVSAEPTPSPTPVPTPEPAATPTPTPAPTPEPTLAPTPAGLPSITKNPSGELVSPGGTAIFVAKALDAERIEWYLADPNGSEPEEITGASELFSGLWVDGQGTETLSVSGIPQTMNGWQVECRFTGSTGAVSTSSRATITVRRDALEAPALIIRPEEQELYAGETAVLSVRAVPPEGGEVLYQWYSAGDRNLAAIRAIDGATGDTFAPPVVEGTVYYCVGARSLRNMEESSAVFSPLVAVTCLSEVRQHVHDFSGAWRWSDQTHWKECSCGLRQEEAYHELEWTVEKKASSGRDGLRRGVCPVCGYETTQIIPAGGQTESPFVRTLLICAVALVGLILVLGAAFVIYNVVRLRRLRRRRPRSGSYNGTHTRRPRR